MESTMGKKVLIGAAWPYVNGSLHLGHAAALLPADILARYFRAHGDDVLYVSGSDCHGTPILVTADREGQTPEAVANRYHDEFVETLIRKLGCSYTLYTKTMGAFHQQHAQVLFQTIHDRGFMVPRTETNPYCATCARFLPDRYVEGKCPNPDCQKDGARGDQCDACGHVHDTRDLVAPVCRTCRVAPEWRSSTHLYFRLPLLAERLTAWIATQKHWRDNALNMTKAWIERGLQDRPITRDLEWGVPVPIPDFTDKRMYVWFEAVMGYLTCSREWAESTGNPEAWREWWENEDAVHYYVHGKDNIPFHTIIWPGMLMALGLHLPNWIVSSEYMNFGKVKFSKSAGTAIWLPSALATFDPDAIRFYLMLNGPEVKDTNFDWKDFQHRVNGDLVGNVGNFWNRTLALVHRHFESVPAPGTDAESAELIAAIAQAFDAVGTAIARAEFRKALTMILEISQRANRYISTREPWRTIKTDRDRTAATLGTCVVAVDAIRRLIAPFVPTTAERLGVTLGDADIAWRCPDSLAGRVIAAPSAIIPKVDETTIDAEIARMRSSET